MAQEAGGPAALILAAGGIVEKGEGADLRIALIYRERRYQDWSLPKGKQDAGESLPETALREVQEETAVRAVITGFAGCVNYFHKDIPKAVFYWKMKVLVEEPFAPGDEVQELVWLRPDEALLRLSYEDEKQLLRGIYGLVDSMASIEDDEPTAKEAIAVFEPFPFSPNQKIRIDRGPRRGDWQVLALDERKLRLRCPVSGREVEWERFCYLKENRRQDWPQIVSI